MRTQHSSFHSRSGFALEATLLIMLLISVLIVIAFAGLVSTTRTANLDYRNTRAFYASEAAAENVVAQLDNALADGSISSSDLAKLTRPTIPGFTIDSFSAVKVGSAYQETITNGPYAGLYSLTQNMEIYTSAVDAIGDRSANIVDVKAQSIPIFQFGVFFEKDLEVTNGPPMTFAGWIHSNGNIYLSSANQWFTNMVTTPNNVYHDRKDYHNILNGVYINNAAGTAVQLTFDSRTKPNPADFIAASHASFDDRLKTNAYKVDSLKMPLPKGMDPIAVMQPRNAGDSPQVQQAKYAWNADWYIAVPLDQINNPGKNLCPTMNSTRPAGKVLPSSGDCKNIFTWTWDAFFDGREKRYVDVLDINIDQLRSWVNKNPATNSTQVLYVTFTGTPAQNASTDPMGDGFRPVVRLLNGHQLPNPLAVATDRPLYVAGDYNKDNWVPAALVGDALTILSNAWNDGNIKCNPYVPNSPTLALACTGYQMPKGNNTQVWAAVLAGSWPTPCDHEVAPCAGGYQDFYGGGLENFPRFLEDWSGQTLTYRGSLVSVSYSQYTTGTWDGNYYSPPTRDWQFDTRFNDPANLPPGTPVVGNVIHTAYRPVY